LPSSALKMETACYSKTLVHFYHSTRSHTQEDSTPPARASNLTGVFCPSLHIHELNCCVFFMSCIAGGVSNNVSILESSALVSLLYDERILTLVFASSVAPPNAVSLYHVLLWCGWVRKGVGWFQIKHKRLSIHVYTCIMCTA
jgi:hypothetical protein